MGIIPLEPCLSSHANQHWYVVKYYRRWTVKSNPCCIVINPHTPCAWVRWTKKSNPEHKGNQTKFDSTGFVFFCPSTVVPSDRLTLPWKDPPLMMGQFQWPFSIAILNYQRENGHHPIQQPKCSMVLEYLPTFSPKMAQIWRSIFQHH